MPPVSGEQSERLIHVGGCGGGGDKEELWLWRVKGEESSQICIIPQKANEPAIQIHHRDRTALSLSLSLSLSLISTEPKKNFGRVDSVVLVFLCAVDYYLKVMPE